MSLLDDGITKSVGILTANPVATAVGAGVAGVGIGLASSAVIGSSTKSRSKRTHTKRGWKQDRKRFNKSQKWEVQYRKNKAKRARRSRGKKIYYAKKTGQPYILLSSGKARFIKGKRRHK